eukprot:scaffold33308_cov31-Attheya_sp.AAC.2
MNTISTFDTRHEEDEDMPVDKDALAHIVQLLWAAAHELVAGTPFLAANKEPCYIDWSSSLHKECLAVPAPALQNNQNGSHSRPDHLEKMNHLHKEASTDKKEIYNQLHPVYICLLLNALSTDGSTAPVDSFNNDAQHFFEYKTVGAANIHLEHS